MMNEMSRRSFLSHAGGGLSVAWISAHWPQMVVAATHARQAAQSGTPYTYRFLTAEEATEVDAISARIIPTGEGPGEKTPGAREAGVVYFIDGALMTFAAEDQKKYREGLPDIQAVAHEKFPGVQNFSAASAEQQDEILDAISEENAPKRNRRGQRQFAEGQGATGEHQAARDLFEALRIHTISGFLIEPESGGNHDGVGWKWIGREQEHAFQPPFGYYDKNYPGWQPLPKAAEKK